MNLKEMGQRFDDASEAFEQSIADLFKGAAGVLFELAIYAGVLWALVYIVKQMWLHS